MTALGNYNMTISETALRIATELEIESAQFNICNENLNQNKLTNLLEQTDNPAEIGKIKDIIADSVVQKVKLIKNLNHNKELLKTL